MLDLPMPGRGIQHVDLAVSDVDRSLAFYLDLLGPLGLREEERYPTYRGTEDVVYLSLGDEWLGLRPADGGAHRYYGVGSSTWPSRSTRGKRWTRRISGVRHGAIGSTTRRRRTATSPATTRSSSSIRMGSASRSSRPGRIGPHASIGRLGEARRRDKR
jgi:catechol 2,3-dioxygenase-like lactoylglutathione lyase family enzyme